MSEDSVWVEWEQTTCSPGGGDIPLRERPFPCRAVQRGEMFLADRACTSSKQSFSLIAIGCLQGGKDYDITRLELVGGVRGQATQDDVVLETELQDFEGLVCPKAVTNQYPWLLVSLFFGLGVKYTREPL